MVSEASIQYFSLEDYYGIRSSEEQNFSIMRKLMVHNLRSNPQVFGITSEPVLQSLSSVPRHLYVLEDQRPFAYNNVPLIADPDQYKAVELFKSDHSELDTTVFMMNTITSTISSPHVVGLMTQMLDVPGLIEQKMNNLQAGSGLSLWEVGTASGYQTAILEDMLAQQIPEGNIRILTTEINPTMVPLAQERLRTTHMVEVRQVDQGTLFPDELFDGIVVTAGMQLHSPIIANLCDQIGRGVWSTRHNPSLWDSLLIQMHVEEALQPYCDRLKVGGRVVIPIGTEGFQFLVTGQKTADGMQFSSDGKAYQFVKLH